MYSDLADKVAVVTGGGRGLGAGVVQRLLEEGARVLAVDIDPDTLRQEAAERDPARYSTIAADVASVEGTDCYVDAAVARFGRIDLFVNNAAILGPQGPITEIPIEAFDRTHAVNVRGMFLGLRAVLRRMIAQGDGGAIVNVSSVSGLRSRANGAAYGSSKRAIIGLSNSAALENGQYGIRVNAICPGQVLTPMTAGVDRSQSGLTAVTAARAIQRGAEPAEIAAFIAYLLSEQASYHTAGVYTVDGGAIA